jgi:hypothetical protein
VATRAPTRGTTGVIIKKVFKATRVAFRVAIGVATSMNIRVPSMVVARVG